MQRRRAILASIVIVASFVACSRTGDRVMKTFDGPVKIESVQRYGYVNMCSWEVGPNGYPRMVVHDDRTFEIMTAEWCHDATVKQHGPKKLIAFYCPTKYGPDFEKWRIIRRLGEGKYVEDCSIKGAAAPDLERVAPLAESAASMVRCTYDLQGHGEGLSGNKYMATRYRAIADGLAKSDGAQAVAKMLEQTLDIPPLNDPDEDGWVLEVGRLESGVRTEFLERVCRTLERGDSSNLAYVRAARVCPLDADAVKARAVERMKRSLDDRALGDDFESSIQAWLWSAAIATRTKTKPWGAEVDAPIPRPRKIAYPKSRDEFVCDLKQAYDAGTCAPYLLRDR